MLLVDSTVWIDYFNGVENQETNYLDRAIQHIPILVGDLILVEVLQGFRQDADFEAAQRALGKFLQVSLVTPDLAIQSVQNYRTLRQKGITVRKTIDAIIATYCIKNDHELLHNDSDFNGYETYLGLKVIRSNS